MYKIVRKFKKALKNEKTDKKINIYNKLIKIVLIEGVLGMGLFTLLIYLVGIVGIIIGVLFGFAFIDDEYEKFFSTLLRNPFESAICVVLLYLIFRILFVVLNITENVENNQK